MLEVSGRVVVVSGCQATVVVDRAEPGCSGCGLRTGCGAGLRGLLTRAPEAHCAQVAVRVPEDLVVRPGSRVVLGIAENSLLLSAAYGYLLPLLTLLVAAGLAEGLWGRDGLTALCGLAGLGTGLLLSRIRGRKIEMRLLRQNDAM